MNDQILVSREMIQQVIESLEYFASQMTVGQRYTNEGQTAIDAPVDLREAIRNQPKPNIHGRRVGNVRYFDGPALELVK